MEAKLIEHAQCVPNDKVKIEFTVDQFCDIFVISVPYEFDEDEDIPEGYLPVSQ